MSPRALLPALMASTLAALAVVATVGCATPQADAHDRDGPGWPVILVHGFAGTPHYPLIGSYFRGIDEALAADGIEPVVPALPAYASSARRGEKLGLVIDEVLEATGAEKVHIIGHSQGGLDARHLVEDETLGPKYRDKIGTLTALSSPHRGTPVAGAFDWLPGPMIDLALSVANTGTMQGIELVDGRGAVHTLSPKDDHTQKYLPGLLPGPRSDPETAYRHLDVDDYPVPAFSLAGVAGLHEDGACDAGLWGKPHQTGAPQPWLTPTAAMLAATEPGRLRSSDGLVPVDSAIWQNFLGCIPADHVTMIGLGFLGNQPATDLDEPFDAPAFFVAYVRALRAVEKSGKAEAMVGARPPLVGHWLH